MATDEIQGAGLPQIVAGHVKEFDTRLRDWRDEAREMYAFVAGDQWDEADVAKLREDKRPVVTFNRIGPIVDACCGSEIMNRQSVVFKPREPNDTGLADLYTSAGMFVRDEGGFEDLETEAFRDCAICGMGWTQTRMEYEEEPDGQIVLERIDPLEMGWDARARAHNLSDAKYIWRRQRFTLDDIRERWPGKAEDLVRIERDFSAEIAQHRSDPGDDYSSPSSSTEAYDEKARYEVIEYEWCELQPVFLVMDGVTGEVAEFEPDRFEVLADRAKRLQIPIDAVQQRRKRWFRVVVSGATILEDESPLPAGYSFRCITGKRDRNKGYWYGIVRAMIDPQRWANKFFAKIQHNIATQGSGVMIERGSVPNQHAFEESWAKPDAPTWFNDGALAKSKVQPKFPGMLPPGLSDMMAFAISSIRDTSGVNLELLGMANRQQAGILEQERKKAGITVLAGMFDSLRRYRKASGRLLLEYIHRFFPPRKLLRIAGDTGERYIEFTKAPGNVRFDVVVDDVPSSASMKERVWGIMTEMLPVLVNQPIPPEVWAEAIRFSPLPASLADKVAAALTKPPQPDPAAAERQKLENEELRVDIEKTKAEVEETLTDALLNRAKAIEAGAKSVEAGANAIRPDPPRQSAQN